MLHSWESIKQTCRSYFLQSYSWLAAVFLPSLLEEYYFGVYSLHSALCHEILCSETVRLQPSSIERRLPFRVPVFSLPVLLSPTPRLKAPSAFWNPSHLNKRSIFRTRNPHTATGIQYWEAMSKHWKKTASLLNDAGNSVIHQWWATQSFSPHGGLTCLPGSVTFWLLGRLLFVLLVL